QLLRLHDAGVVFSPEVTAIARERRFVARDVFFARAVTGLATDSELGDLRVERAVFIDARLAERRVTGDAARIPAAFRDGLRRMRWLEKDRIARHPLLIGLQEREGNLTEVAIVSGLVPVNLHVVRPGDQRDWMAVDAVPRRLRDVDIEAALRASE